MMFWLYCPIKEPFGHQVIPGNLRWCMGFLGRIMLDEPDRVWESYVYITAKTLWVTPENPGNRPGWHSDGFMTDDLNYIWSDCNPTEFWVPEKLVELTQDHTVSMREMDELVQPHEQLVYGNKHLLKLDETVIHRVQDLAAPCMRTFVKISVSKHQYRLKGNSINHELGLDWEYVDRQAERNTPEVVK